MALFLCSSTGLIVPPLPPANGPAQVVVQPTASASVVIAARGADVRNLVFPEETASLPT